MLRNLAKKFYLDEEHLTVLFYSIKEVRLKTLKMSYKKVVNFALPVCHGVAV